MDKDYGADKVNGYQSGVFLPVAGSLSMVRKAMPTFLPIVGARAATLAAASALFLCLAAPGRAGPFVMLPDSPETRKYLVIATGEGATGNEFAAFQMSNVELGADQEIVSNSSVGAPSQRVGSFPGGLDLTGTFVPSNGANASLGGNRWNDIDPDHSNDTVGVPDRLPGARPIFEGIDFSGNVALTGARAKFESSNADVNAGIGIQCNRTPAGCFPNPSGSNSYFAPGDPNNEQDLNALNGVSQFTPTALTDELKALRDFIVALPSDTTLTAGFVNQNIKDSASGAKVTDLDVIDANGVMDGIAVIDIDVDGNKFELNNTDWILKSTSNTLAIFRMKDGVQFDFSNSSIVLGDGSLNSTDVIDNLGAIFFMDAFKGTNELFNLNNVILGGIGLWDFTDFNPQSTVLLSSMTSAFNPSIGDRTVVNLQNAQGCAQFISHEVLMSNNRWNRCALDGPPDIIEVSEPAGAAIFGFGLAALAWLRRRRAD